MYKIGIVVNENEVAHSKYADSLATISSAINESNQNGKKGNSFYFIVFDKFNIQSLFEKGENNILSFDGLVIGTNAMGFNEKIHNTFCNNKQHFETYLNSNKGLFISSQKKLSNGSLGGDLLKGIGFLPEIYDYYVFDRPEKYSSDGEITICDTHKILSYPYEITNDLVKHHCENNHFMIHKYRSLIIPKHANAYEALLSDAISPSVSHENLGYLNGERKVLLSSRYNKRIIISTMALDWANHVEILCNVLTFITESKQRILFIKHYSEYEKSTIIDSYIIRALIANLPYRVIGADEIERFNKTAGNVFIFSPNWTINEVEKKYIDLLNDQKKYFSIYHICSTTDDTSNNHKLSKYSNFSSIDTMKDGVIQNLLGNYLTNSWNKSVWTYSYILTLIEFFDFNIPFVAKKIYKELSNHFTKKDEILNKIELTSNYDNVFNATCKMQEILTYFNNKYHTLIDEQSHYNIEQVIISTDKWLITKVEKDEVIDQDVCYYLLYLLKSNKLNSLSVVNRDKLMQLYNQLLTIISEEILSSKINNRQSIDLSRIHQTLCLLNQNNIFPKERVKTYIDKIEIILKERQDIYGNWKNISETSEITAMLLEIYEYRMKVADMNMINDLITKGIEVLHSMYNSKNYMWSEDLGTTAKAMYAIGMYDRRFNFAINDFFIDLKNSQETDFSTSDANNLDWINSIYLTVDGLEKEKEMLKSKAVSFEKTITNQKLNLSKIKKWLLLLLAMFIGILFILFLILLILYTGHKEILLSILGDWKSYIIEGFVGLLLTIALTAAYNKFSKKLIN